MKLYREEKATSVPPAEIFEIGDVKHAFQYLQKNPRSGKVIVTLENLVSKIQVHHTNTPHTNWS